MYRKYYLVEVVILLLLSHGGWNGPSVTLLSCTSEASELVRSVVHSRFVPVVDRYRVSLPLECPLHPERDMFGHLQTHVEGAWHCPVCGRRFTCENTFVTHWDAKHARNLGMAGETVCLDDYCDVFRCDVLREKRYLQEARNDIDTFQKQQEVDIKSKVQQCDSDEMKRLQHKCRSLIRQCTMGMLSNLSNKDFHNIEDDLDQSICSFLTCDKYWDDFGTQVHPVPVLVIGIFVLIIIGLFCLCYYGTYLLLEKFPGNSVPLCHNCQKSQSPDLRQHPRHQRTKHRSTSPDSRPQYLDKLNHNDYFMDHSADSTRIDSIRQEPTLCLPDTPIHRKSPDNRNTPSNWNTPDNRNTPSNWNTPDSRNTPSNWNTSDNRNTPSSWNAADNRNTPSNRNTHNNRNTPEFGPYLRAPSRMNSPDWYNYSPYSENRNSLEN